MFLIRAHRRPNKDAKRRNSAILATYTPRRRADLEPLHLTVLLPRGKPYVSVNAVAMIKQRVAGLTGA